MYPVPLGLPQKPSEPLDPMQVRFLEIISEDSRLLLVHSQDEAYFIHNAKLLRGFVSALNLAYSDKGFPVFSALLTYLQESFFTLSSLKVGAVEHLQLISAMHHKTADFILAFQLDKDAGELP